MSYKCVFAKINGTLGLDCLVIVDGTDRKDAIEYVEWYLDEDCDSEKVDIELDAWCIGTGQIESYDAIDFEKEFGIDQDTLLELYEDDRLEKTFEDKGIYCERLRDEEYALEVDREGNYE